MYAGVCVKKPCFSQFNTCTDVTENVFSLKGPQSGTFGPMLPVLVSSSYNIMEEPSKLHQSWMFGEDETQDQDQERTCDLNPCVQLKTTPKFYIEGT